MSNHMSAKALRTFSIQVEGGRMRRAYASMSRAEQFEAQRVINRAIGLEIKAERTVARKVERCIGFFMFLYLQAMGVTYLWWLLG